MSINELPLSLNTGSLITGISSQQLSQLWKGKTFHQLTTSQTGNIERFVPSHPQEEMPHKLDEHTFIKLETPDNQSFLVEFTDVASILSLSKTELQRQVKENPQDVSKRFQKTADLKPLPKRNKDDIRKELTNHLNKEWHEHINLITQAYETLASDPSLLLNLKGEKTESSEYFSKKKSNSLLKNSIIRSPDGELYVVIPKGTQEARKPGQTEGQWSAALGAGVDSIYTRLVNLHTLTPMAFGRVRHTLTKSGKVVATPQVQRQQIQKEIAFQKKLQENFKGKKEDFPFIRLKAMVAHESNKYGSATKGREKYARLTELADDDLRGWVENYFNGNDLTDPDVRQNAINLIRDLLNALVLIKQSGIIHRDLKPENLMLIRVPPPADNKKRIILRLKVADFGNADFLDEAKKSKPQVTGTPDYLSYNQYHSSNTDDLLNPSNDLWAAGIVMYEILTGTLPPFGLEANSPTLHATLTNYGNYTREDIRGLVTPAAEDTVLGLVNKIFTEDPPPTVEDFLREFKAILTQNGPLVPS